MSRLIRRVLALKTGNAIVLRGGQEKRARSNQRLVEIPCGCSGSTEEGAIELLDSSTRQSVQELINGARRLVDGSSFRRRRVD